MRFAFQSQVCISLTALLTACGSDTPSFIEKPEGVISVKVDSSAPEHDESSFDIDELTSHEDESGTPSMAYPGLETEAGAGRNEQALKKPSTSSSNSSSANVTAKPAESSGGTNGDPGNSAKAVAKACLPHFQGVSQKIRVIDAERASDLSITPGTIIAFKLSGNNSKLSITLPAGNDLPGVCFFVSGHEAKVEFSTASLIQGFAYIARGDQSSGSIEFLAGSPTLSHISLKGNQPSLNVVGLDSALCGQATLQGNAPQLMCNP